MLQDKTVAGAPLWLRLLHRSVLPLATGAHGWLLDPGHWSRSPGDYCPFRCSFCNVQKVLDNTPARPRRRPTPVT